MHILENNHVAQVCGGQCTGNGSSSSGSINCTVHENKNWKFEASVSASKTQGVTRFGVSASRKFP